MFIRVSVVANEGLSCLLELVLSLMKGCHVY